jgi:hypothetical protein
VPASGIAADSQGRAVFTDFQSINSGISHLNRVTPAGDLSRLLTWNGFFTAVAVNAQDDIFVLVDSNGSTVRGISASVLKVSMTADGPVVSIVASDGLLNARGLAADEAGNAYVALGDCRIVRVQANGTRDVIAGHDGRCTCAPAPLKDADLPIGRGEFEFLLTTRGTQSLKYRDGHLLMKMDDGIVRIGPLTAPTGATRSRAWVP